MMLQAVSISRAVATGVLQDGLVGEVHSTFDRACNLRFGEHLVGLVVAALGNGPNAILVEGPPGGFAASGSWRPGEPVRVAGERLLLGGGGGVALMGARLWDPEPQAPATMGDLAAAATALGQALRFAGPAGGIHGYVLAHWEGGVPPAGPMALASGRIEALGQACLSGPSELIAQSATRLVGLGPGLTPSGDDLLAGLTATLVRATRWGMAPGLVATTEALCALLTYGCQGRTTLPSESMLRSAARGWLAEAASDLVTGLLGGLAGSMGHLPRLLTLGHTSGADMAAGIYMALRLIEKGQAGG